MQFITIIIVFLLFSRHVAYELLLYNNGFTPYDLGGITLIAVLGSSDDKILKTRINESINIISSTNQVDLFLSGGLTSNKQISEANKMKSIISKIINPKNISCNYILDEQAQNTSENLVFLDLLISEKHHLYNNVILVTSKFHEKRVKKMVSLLPVLSNLNSLNYIFAPDPEDKENLYYWETRHILNVKQDIDNALSKIYKTN